MSISTSGGNERQPSTVKVGKTTSGGKPPAGSRPGGGKSPQGKGGAKPRKPVTPVKVSGGRNWGPIAVAGAVVLIALGIIGVGVYYVAKSNTGPWEEQVADIEGIVNYRENPDKTLTARNHVEGPQNYKVSPPVGGDHNQAWQNCMGDIYDAPIPNEHAVHSMEHGAVWVTYKLGLGAADVDKLAGKVRGKDYMLMSPVEGLSSNVSLQAWGFQLKLDSVDDDRIDAFIKALRSNASVEPGATCASGVTATGTTPLGGPAPGQAPN